MIGYLRAHGFYDVLPWFRCERWLYHAIKALTATSLAFVLGCVGVPVLWACLVAVLLTVPGAHLVERIASGQPFNPRDTGFDAVCANLLMPPAALAVYGATNPRAWLLCVAWALVNVSLYMILLGRHWNSP